MRDMAFHKKSGLTPVARLRSAPPELCDRHGLVQTAPSTWRMSRAVGVSSMKGDSR